MVERRAGGEPVAYITGRRAFWNIDLHVGPGVLIPRPDSEVLIASAIEHFGGAPGPGAHPRPWHRAGNVAARRARPVARRDRHRRRCLAPGPVLCVGQRPAAGPRRRARTSGSATGRTGIKGTFDLILCNPPYVATDEELGPGVAEYRAGRSLVRRARRPGRHPPAGAGNSAAAGQGRAGRGRDRVATRRSAAAAFWRGRDLAPRVAQRSRRPAAGGAANLGLNEFAWNCGNSPLHLCSGAGPLYRKSAERTPLPPTQSAVLWRLAAPAGRRQGPRIAQPWPKEETGDSFYCVRKSAFDQ